MISKKPPRHEVWGLEVDRMLGTRKIHFSDCSEACFDLIATVSIKVLSAVRQSSNYHDDQTITSRCTAVINILLRNFHSQSVVNWQLDDFHRPRADPAYQIYPILSDPGSLPPYQASACAVIPFPDRRLSCRRRPSFLRPSLPTCGARISLSCFPSGLNDTRSEQLSFQSRRALRNRRGRSSPCVCCCWYVATTGLNFAHAFTSHRLAVWSMVRSVSWSALGGWLVILHTGRCEVVRAECATV
ncbi:hypothetical protein EDC01DRAFT_194000 [Geopyxis carbonaria]|nr:hypothetical protein EDC01DRAFT_194000 [Geopyxis carbonaria]